MDAVKPTNRSVADNNDVMPDILQRKNSLERALSFRPPVTTLLQRNILHSTASPALQATQDQLRFHRRADSLDHALKQMHFRRRADSLDHALKVRPDRDQLVRNGILYNELDHSMMTRLDDALMHRPSRGELITLGILVPTDLTEPELNVPVSAISSEGEDEGVLSSHE